MPATAETKPPAISTNATQRLAELEAVRHVLLPDAANPAVAAEISHIKSEIKTAVAAINNEQPAIVAEQESDSDQ